MKFQNLGGEGLYTQYLHFFGGWGRGGGGSNGIGLNFDQNATFPDERLAVETENKT